jgi:hypothetical protein
MFGENEKKSMKNEPSGRSVAPSGRTSSRLIKGAIGQEPSGRTVAPLGEWLLEAL